MSHPAHPSPPDAVTASPPFHWHDLGTIPYADAYTIQTAAVETVLAARDAQQSPIGIIHLLEHPPVITISRRPEARQHLTATPQLLQRFGVALAETDRGGDITYHGPGQLVVYPIIDLNRLNLGLHAYMRLLEEAAIRTCAAFGVPAMRDPAATGVWTVTQDGLPHAKLCACGVRVRKWVSMHGLAINVSTNLDHFNLIVPCGLAGRPVTSLHSLLGADCPIMGQAKQVLRGVMAELLNEAQDLARVKRFEAIS